MGAATVRRSLRAAVLEASRAAFNWPLLSLVSFVLVVSLSAAYPSNNYRDLDICNHWNGRRHFLELGERGDLHARNVTTSAFRSTLFSPSNPANAGPKNRSSTDIWYQCNLELVTCAECVIRITFTHTNFSKTCERVANTAMAIGKASLCPCEHIQFSEPPYDSTISGQEFCGDGKVFRSKTRTLLLKFFYRATNSHVFSLQYFSERNVKIVSGTPKQSIHPSYTSSSSSSDKGTGTTSTSGSNAPQVIATPYFPFPYQRDYEVEHILTCESENCQVRLDFTDFQLGLTSTLEIFDSNGQMLDSYTGEHFRPPITISQGKSLLLQFRGNGVAGIGFRAEVTFVSSKQLKEDRLVPYTDCGGMVSGPGGAITMMNMIDNSSDIRLYDCIWIIKPGNNYMMMKTHISLRVDEFHGMASRSDLTVRQGTTSDALEIEEVSWPNNGMSKDSHIVPILTGYYIRLRGVFGMSSRLAIVYSVFNYLNCYIGSEFLCGNNHCISIRLHCDGFDHCGDGSDEPDTCEQDWAHLHNDRRWYSHKPNYYFPKIEQYPDLKTATGIFIISTLGIFAVLSGWMVILYRMGVRARHQRELQNHLQTISELLDRQEEMSPPDEPPSYEAPPDYEEVIKVGMEQELQEPRHRQRRRHHRHHRDRERSCSRASSCATLQSALVPVHSANTLEMPSTSAAAAAAASAGAAASLPECTEPASGSNGGPQSSNMQELANRMLRATAACGLAAASATSAAAAATGSASAAKRRRCHARAQCGQCSAVGLPASSVSLSSGCELPHTSGGEPHHQHAPQQQHQQPCNSQYEERSSEFRDDSLNISFTLAMPPTTMPSATTAPASVHVQPSNRPKSSVLHCNEQTHLKRSWIVVNNGDGKNYKVQRLRHTFSSPDGFAVDTPASIYSEILGYGTNLPYDRSFLFSNATTFGSDLSRDPSGHSICCSHQHQPPQQPHLCYTHGQPCTMRQVVVGVEEMRQHGDDGEEEEDDDEEETTSMQKELLHTADDDSDTEPAKISCFGNVGGHRQRHGRHRSRSFSSHQRRPALKAIKRCSSADLLVTGSEARPGRGSAMGGDEGATAGRWPGQKVFLI